MARTRIRAQASEPPAEPPGASQDAPEPEAAPAPPAGRRRTQAATSAPSKPNGAPPPQTAAQALASKPGAQDAAQALAAALDEEPEPPKVPFSAYPNPSEQLAKLIEKVIDEGEGVDLLEEFDKLAKQLEIVDALTPQAVKKSLNQVEANAMRAHRLFVLTKAQFETYRIHAETALGAMRDVARHKLEQLKATKQMSKQVTERDVDDVAATTYPDEWSNITDRLKRSKLTLDHLERFAELWQRRSWSLAALNQ